MTVKNIDPFLDTAPEVQQDLLLDEAVDQELAPHAEDLFEVGLDTPEPETTQVAGIGKVVKTIGEAAARTPEKPHLKTPKEPLEEGPQIVPPKGEIEGKPPETIFNLNKIDGPDELKEYIDSVAQASGAGQIERMNFGELTSKIEEMGYSESFVAKIINPNTKLNADPAEVYKMMLALTDSGKRSMDLAEKVKKAAADGSITDELIVEFRQAVALQGVISKGAKQKQADIARSLAMFNQARRGEFDRGFDLEQVMNASGGRGDAVALAKAISDAGSMEKAHKVAERTLGTRAKDIWLTTWINGILSSPVTHVKNMTANTMFAGLNLLEKQTASLIGQGRRALFGSKDYIAQEEILVDAYSMAQGVREGAQLARSAWKNNQQVTGLSKVELPTISDPFNVKVADDASDFSKAMAKGFGYWGKFVTAPGRALMAEDEFFKAFNYRRQLNSLAYREQRRYFDELIDAGEDTASAQEKAQQRMLQILNDPPDDLHRESIDFAGEMTFTKDLEGRLGSMERIAQHPLVKIYVPFIRTPTNIAIELNKRLPTTFISKKTRDDWAAGGVKRDMVIAKATLGSSILYGIGSIATEGSITGAGPYSPDQKAGLQATGWQPYSFVLNKGDVSKEQLEEFKKFTTVSSGTDYVYVSYAGLEPIGALFGMGATIGEYGIMEPDASVMEQLFTGAALGASDYISELPMISGVSEMMNTFRGRGKEGTDYMLNVFKRMTEQASEVAIGGSPAGAYSSLIAYTERVLNPERRSPRSDYEDYADLNPAFKGFLDTLAQYQSRNPLLSKDAPPVIDPITGEQLKHAASQSWMRAFPFKLSEQKYSPAYDVLNAFGIGQYKPKKKIDGIDLNATQYNRYIELATTTPLGGKTLEDAIAELRYNTEFMAFAEADPLKAKNNIVSIRSDYYSMAKKMLLDEESGLSMGAEIKKAGEEVRIESRIQTMLQ